MNPNEILIPLTPAAFFPSTSFTGSEQPFIIRGENLFLKSKGANQMYAVAYKGSFDMSEDIPPLALTGTIAYSEDGLEIVGTGTAFMNELRTGVFIVTATDPSQFVAIEDVIDDTHALVSRPFTATGAGVTAKILPVMYALGNKRATQSRGNTVKFPKGHLLGVGKGELRLNGQSLSTPFNLDTLPKYALFTPPATYTIVGFGVPLPTPFTFTLAESATAATKNMQAGAYAVVLVAKSTQTKGYSQPSAQVNVTITANKQIRILLDAAMNTAEGQDAYDVYVTKFIDSASNVNNARVGVLYYYETVTAAQLATENAVADGTVTGLFHDFEFLDGELSDLLLSFDNFAPLDCEWVDLSGTTPVFFAAEGKATTAKENGISPGPSIVPCKPDNPEGVMRDKTVKTFQGDSIIGVHNVRGRWFMLCENSMQAAILTGIDAAPITCRSYWDVGFRNPYNLKFLKDYIFGYSTHGFIRSIGVGDTSDIDLDFSPPVDDFTIDWICSHELTAFDPKNKAICFFFAGFEKRSGYWATMVLPYLPSQGHWNPPIILKKTDADFIVSGAATVGNALYFLAGGRKSNGTIESKTYEFDRVSGEDVECYLAWSFTDMNLETSPQAISGVGSVIYCGNDAKVEIHGITEDGTFDLDALEDGHSNPLYTVELGSKANLGRVSSIRQQVPTYSKWTARFSFTSVNGTGRLDELNLLCEANASEK